eukprot:3752467-Amphidinium_carterae.1
MKVTHKRRDTTLHCPAQLEVVMRGRAHQAAQWEVVMRGRAHQALVGSASVVSVQPGGTEAVGCDHYYH